MKEQCPNCGGSGEVEIGEHEIIITRDMAMDGGIDLEYVGAVWDTEIEYEECPLCGGIGMI